jgi:hypothetical protein
MKYEGWIPHFEYLWGRFRWENSFYVCIISNSHNLDEAPADSDVLGEGMEYWRLESRRQLLPGREIGRGRGMLAVNCWGGSGWRPRRAGTPDAAPSPCRVASAAAVAQQRQHGPRRKNPMQPTYAPFSGPGSQTHRLEGRPTNGSKVQFGPRRRAFLNRKKSIL